MQHIILINPSHHRELGVDRVQTLLSDGWTIRSVTAGYANGDQLGTFLLVLEK